MNILRLVYDSNYEFLYQVRQTHCSPYSAAGYFAASSKTAVIKTKTYREDLIEVVADNGDTHLFMKDLMEAI